MHKRLWILVAVAISFVGCSDEKLINGDGMPSQLANIKCGSTVEELIRAYPSLTVERSDSRSASYCRETPGVDKVCAMVLDGTLAIATVYFMRKHKLYDFGNILERLEKELGKGEFNTVKKTVKWNAPSTGVKSISLMSNADYTALVATCP